MSIKTCSECGGKVSSGAKQCPHCGKPNPTSNSGGQLFGAVVVGLLIAYWWTSSSEETEPATPSQVAEDKPLTAAQQRAERRRSMSLAGRHYCRQAITNMLHDPDSADWAPGYKWPVSIDDNRVTVQASLRANNAFGGKVLDTFTCVVEMQGNSGRVVSIE